MSQDSVILVANNVKSRNDLIDRGFSRQPLRIDVDIACSLEALAHVAWSIPKDKYYDGGDRYRSLNRVRAEIVEGGVKVWSSEENTPYVQLKKYNPTLGDQPREYAPLPPAIAASMGVRKHLLTSPRQKAMQFSSPNLCLTARTNNLRIQLLRFLLN